MYLFEQDGLWGASRMAHVIVGVMWMGLLWFFNFVQVPAFAQMDAGARNEALDKLSWRALWWFRWAAAATVVFGLLIIMVQPDIYMEADYWTKTTAGATLLIGILFGLTMFANVWLVIWPNQQVVIGNARNVAAGGEANPDAPAKGRSALMASRQNTIFSLPLLVFMVGASHFYGAGFDSGGSAGKYVFYILVGIVIMAVMEANALGYISGTGSTGLNWMYESHKNAMYTGFGLIVFFYLFAEILLG